MHALNPSAPFLSIVMPVYQAGAVLHELHARVSAAARSKTEDYEIVFVNDGSTDHSLELLKEIHAVDAHVVVIDLSRNFGQHQAIWRGLMECRGERIFLLDGDLDDQPEWLADLSAAMEQSGADLVLASSPHDRRGLREVLTCGFYHLLALLADIPMHPNIICARLMTRRYLDALLLHKERNLYLSTLFALTGFTQHRIALHKPLLHPSNYNFAKLLILAGRGFVSASVRPLNYVGVVGIVAGLACMLAATTGMTESALLSSAIGFVMFQLGVISLYIAAILRETQQRPLSIVRDIYQRQDRADSFAMAKLNAAHTAASANAGPQGGA